MEPVYVENKLFDKENYTLKSLLKGEYENCEFKNCEFAECSLSDYKFTDCVFTSCNLSFRTTDLIIS